MDKDMPDTPISKEDNPVGPIQLPPALIVGISIVLTGLFVLNIVADIFVKGYSGYPTTALLGILVGSVLGIERFLRIGR